MKRSQKRVSKHVSNYLSELGKKGGKATGAAKRRSRAFYLRLSRLGVAARKRKKRGL